MFVSKSSTCIQYSLVSEDRIRLGICVKSSPQFGCHLKSEVVEPENPLVAPDHRRLCQRVAASLKPPVAGGRVGLKEEETY